MKRSEMLKIIEKTLYPYYIDSIYCYYPSQIAEAILQTVENSGMLPPFTHDLYAKTWRDGGEGHEWEAE